MVSVEITLLRESNSKLDNFNIACRISNLVVIVSDTDCLISNRLLNVSVIAPRKSNLPILVSETSSLMIKLILLDKSDMVYLLLLICYLLMYESLLLLKQSVR